MATWAVWLMKLTMEPIPMRVAPIRRRHDPHHPSTSGRKAIHRKLHIQAAQLSLKSSARVEPSTSVPPNMWNNARPVYF